MGKKHDVSMKAYCAWWGPDRHLRLLKARVDDKGNATIKRGPPSVKVTPTRCGVYRNRPVFQVVGQAGEAQDVWGDGAGTLVTSLEYDEANNNAYASQVFEEMNRSAMTKVRDWMVIGALALLIVAQFYSLSETKDAINAVAQAIQLRLGSSSPPGGVPTTAFVWFG